MHDGYGAITKKEKNTKMWVIEHANNNTNINIVFDLNKSETKCVNKLQCK